MVSMLPICIYISLMFGNYVYDKGVQNSFSSGAGVELNLEAFDLGGPPLHPSRAPSWMLNVRMGAFQREAGQGFSPLSLSVNSGPHPKGKCLRDPQKGATATVKAPFRNLSFFFSFKDG